MDMRNYDTNSEVMLKRELKFLRVNEEVWYIHYV